MPRPERRAAGPIDYVLIGFFVAAIGGALAAGGGGFFGVLLAAVGGVVTTIGTIALGVRVGLEDAERRRSDDRRTTG